MQLLELQSVDQLFLKVVLLLLVVVVVEVFVLGFVVVIAMRGRVS